MVKGKIIFNRTDGRDMGPEELEAFKKKLSTYALGLGYKIYISVPKENL
jgi:hypothetical protein